MPRSDPLLQACYEIFGSADLHWGSPAWVERKAEIEAFARLHRPAELGLCRSCWSIFRHGVRHGQCSGDCVLTNEAR